MGSKFMVLKLKDILRTVVFAVLGILFLIAIFNVIFGDDKEEKQVYNPGVYSSEINLSDGRMTVETEVGKNKIKSVSVNNISESVPVFYPLFEDAAETVGKKVVKEQGTDFDLEGTSPMTEKMLLDAVEKNLEKAKENIKENEEE